MADNKPQNSKNDSIEATIKASLDENKDGNLTVAEAEKGIAKINIPGVQEAFTKTVNAKVNAEVKKNHLEPANGQKEFDLADPKTHIFNATAETISDRDEGFVKKGQPVGMAAAGLASFLRTFGGDTGKINLADRARKEIITETDLKAAINSAITNVTTPAAATADTKQGKPSTGLTLDDIAKLPIAEQSTALAIYKERKQLEKEIEDEKKKSQPPSWPTAIMSLFKGDFGPLVSLVMEMFKGGGAGGILAGIFGNDIAKKFGFASNETPAPEGNQTQPETSQTPPAATPAPTQEQLLTARQQVDEALKNGPTIPTGVPAKHLANLHQNSPAKE